MYEQTPERSSLYSEQLDSILTRPLTPDIIDTYADRALDDLIELVEASVIEYDSMPTVQQVTNQDTERAAFDYFELGDVEQVLDHVANIADEIHSIDAFIASAAVKKTVILPPSFGPGFRDGCGRENHEPKSLVPRLKTLLFVMEQDFGVDINDPEQLQLSTGIVTQDMMRNESYYIAVAPVLNRVVLVNDEVENATFIFDLQKLYNVELNQEQLESMTKSELRGLIDDHPTIGQCIRYTKNFTSRMRSILKEIQTYEEKVDTVDVNDNYLAPRASADHQSARAISRSAGYDVKAVAWAINDLGEALGPVDKMKFGAVTTDGYTREQARMIIARINDSREFYGLVPAPDDVLSVNGIAAKLGISHWSVKNAVNELSGWLGVTTDYRFKAQSATGYTPEQQLLIKEYLTDRGLLSIEKAPDGYESIKSMSASLKISREVLKKLINTSGLELGKVGSFKFGSMITSGYSPEQREMIINHLESTGAFQDATPPEGYLSTPGLARKLGVSPKVIDRIRKQHSEEIGETNNYKFGARKVPGYSPVQQSIIAQYVRKSS